MNQEIFADAFSAVHVTGQLVRIDLLTVQPHLKSDNGQPVVEINRRLIMPLEGFIQSLAVQDNILKQLVEAGVLKKAGNSTEAAGMVAAGELKAEPAKVVEFGDLKKAGEPEAETPESDEK